MLAGGAALLDRAQRLAAAEALAPLEPVALHEHVQPVGQGVDHADAHPVQAAGGLVRLARELAARVQHGEDHLQRALARMAGVRVHRDAAPVVAHRQGAVGREGDLDHPGVAGHRLVHGVVQHLGEQVMQGALVGAADVHAGAPAHGLQPLQHLDVLGRVAAGARRRRVGRGGLGARAGERRHRGRGGGRVVEQGRGGGSGGLGHAGRVSRFGGGGAGRGWGTAPGRGPFAPCPSHVLT